MTPGDFAERVLAFCWELNATELAGYKTDRVADQGGEPPDAAHRAGMARDVVYDQPVSLASAISAAERLGLAIFRNASHDHIEPLGWPPPGVG